jgi:hypothetical protein
MRRWNGPLAWLAAASFFVAAAFWLDRDRHLPREAFQAYSVHNTGETGLSLAFRILEPGRRVETLGRPLERASLDPDGVLFRIRPDSAVPPGLRRGPDPEKGQTEAKPVAVSLLTREEEAWIRGGGRLVLAVDGPYAALEVRGAEGKPAKVFPAWPGVAAIDAPSSRGLAGKALDGAHSIFASGQAVSAARTRIGKGEAILLAWPEIFQNRNLGRADHLALLETLAGLGRPVYFDEFVHDVKDEASAVELLREWGFGTFLVLAGAAALVSFWRRKSRVGPEVDDYQETRVEAVDFVESIALLYNRALTPAQALALYEKTFEQAVAARTGAKDEALRAKVRELRGESGGRRGTDFGRELAALNEAFRRLEDAKRPGSRGKDQGALRRP